MVRTVNKTMRTKKNMGLYCFFYLSLKNNLKAEEITY